MKIVARLCGSNKNWFKSVLQYGFKLKCLLQDANIRHLTRFFGGEKSLVRDRDVTIVYFYRNHAPR